MDPGAEDSQGPMDPKQTPNNGEKEIEPSNSNPEAGEGNIVQTDHLDSSTNDEVIKIDHLASEK